MRRLAAKALLLLGLPAEMSAVGCGARGRPIQDATSPPAATNDVVDEAEEHSGEPYHGELALTKAAEAERLLAAGEYRDAALIAFNGHFYHPDPDIDTKVVKRMSIVRAFVVFRGNEDTWL